MKSNGVLIRVLIVFCFAFLPYQGLMARDIVMVTTNWEPYYGRSLRNQGVIAEIVKSAFKRVGHNARLEWVPWKRAFFLTEQGKKDAVMGAYYSKKRAEKFIYSEPFYNVEVGLVALKGFTMTRYDSLQDLKPFIIGVSAGYANSEEFDAAYYLKKDESRGPLFNIRKLFGKRVQIIAISFGLFKFELAKMKNRSLDDVVFLDPPLSQNDLFILVSRNIPDSEAITADFNQGLGEIKKDGTYQQILSKHGL